MNIDLRLLFSDDAEVMRENAIRAMSKFALKKGIISFSGGMPNPETFPIEAISRFAQEILQEEGANALQYGLTLGHTKLIEALCKFMERRQVFGVAPENIIITNGSAQGIDLVGRLFLNPGDAVLFELPSYIGAILSYANFRATLVGVACDEHGVSLEDLKNKIRGLRHEGKPIKLMYTIPNFQNPSGVTLQWERRQPLLDILADEGVLLVEDDPYGEIYFQGVDPASLIPIKAFDKDHNVIYLGTFSKLLAAGLRGAWAVAHPDIIRKMELAKQVGDICGSSLDQRIIYRCLRDNLIDRHVPVIRKFYEARCQAMLAALEKHFPEGTRWNRPRGGLFVLVTLPEGMDSEALLKMALDEYNVSFVSGKPFFVDGQGANTIRLAYSKETAGNIEEGIRRLGELIKKHLCTPHPPLKPAAAR
ncbi:MAG: PLP-dependent aminotransferase family protein [Acidobacteriia bacterium]|nr:PLP-dependent aminotransferase family protein [Terriglobia bacterium]